jgi:hypothetical protein
MSRTKIHILEGKFKAGLLDEQREKHRLPMNLLFHWNRHNFLTGLFRRQRRDKLEQIKIKDNLNSLIDDTL